MKKILALFAVLVLMSGCMKQDLDDIRKDVDDLKSRVEKLEAWCATVNGQISGLQGLVEALENKDFVTGVTPIMEGTKEVGYTITFTKSNPITILHGKDGAKGTDGITPIIGVKQHTDGLYYWTVKVGDAAEIWMTDKDGNKIRTTGDKGANGEDGVPGEDGTPGTDGNDGHSPVLSVDTFEGKLYWKVDGEWLLHNGNKVPATGDKGDTGSNGSDGTDGTDGKDGDSIFAKDGIDTSDPDNVTFTLADGTTKITLPRTNAVTVGFDSYDVFYCSLTDNEITLVLPSTLKENDYNAIIATVSNSNGTNMDIQTRSANSSDNWGVQVTKPTFTSGNIVEGSAKVTLTLPQNQTNDKAVLRVTIVDSKGKESSVTRIVKVSADVNVIDNTSGALAGKVSNPTMVKQLSVIGTLSDDDFAYIRQNLTSMEVLDLSRSTLTSLPFRAMAFYDNMGLPVNTSLKTVILPETLTTIENSAFAMCKNLQEINIPASVRTLGRWMFEGCEQLSNVVIPNGVTEIPASAFYGCGIKSINMPNTITSIGEWAFQNCKKLESINIPNSVTSIDAWAFADCKKLESANIPSGVTVLNDGLFAYCDNFQNISWHDNITSIGNDVFCLCEKFSMKNLILPAKVTSIGMRTFSGTGVTSVELPQGLQRIDNSAFNHCPIKVVDLPSSITALNATSFLWSAAETVICRSITPPTISLYDDHNNRFSEFYLIKPSCVLKKPHEADYSAWSSYFGGGVENL